MRFIADLHIHSHYSIATSKQLTPEYLDLWARIKGIQVVGTGDFTHPGWLTELEEKLEPAEPGLYRLKETYRIKDEALSRATSHRSVRFMLTAEISNIYKKGGKVRKVHNVLFAPDFQTVRNFQGKLAAMHFNITSDGRPILGLDSRDLLEIALETNDSIFFVPAHIWTPWFSALGAKSGFDTIDACYGDLAHHIHAVETGLSSDPAMNWMCKFLDRFTLISNSDAHSPEKLGREANYFDTDLSYSAITDALKDPGGDAFKGTIEFFPQEGKYHLDGHRKCGICWDPVETLAHKGICPVCGKAVTVGVMNRAAVLSDRDSIDDHPHPKAFDSIVPLKEMIAEIEGVGGTSKAVIRQYNHMIEKLGSEFEILLQQSVDDIASAVGSVYGEGISRMRQRQIHIQEGYDGEFGIIRMFNSEELQKQKQQSTFFAKEMTDSIETNTPRELIPFDLHRYRELIAESQKESASSDNTSGDAARGDLGLQASGLNETQQAAVDHTTGPMMILAGPGTGKTRTLATRIADLLTKHNIPPEHILAITFTNKAAQEMHERIDGVLGNDLFSSRGHVFTFHGLGYDILKNNCERAGRQTPFTLIDEADKHWIFQEILELKKPEIGPTLNMLTQCKQTLKQPEEIEQEQFRTLYERYEAWLKENNAFDLDDLLAWPVYLMLKHEEVLQTYRQLFQWVLVDEYQDLNEAQYALIRLLMPDEAANLCVIGDPNQAIYGFRGADNRFIRQFGHDYPNAAVFHLNQSYRCSNHILNTSGQLLGNVPMLKGLHQGVRVQIASQPTDKSEAEFVARTIESMIGGLRFFSMDSRITSGHEDVHIESLSDFAVLCRTHQQTALIEKAFGDHSIPYQTIGSRHLFDEEPVKTMIDVLRAAHLSNDAFHLKKIAHKQHWSVGEQTSILASILALSGLEEKLDFIQKTLFPNMQRDLTPAYSKLMDLARLHGEEVQPFLHFITLGTEMDLHQPEIEAVSLLTLHASKGLEFKCVFIVGCEDTLLPYSQFNQSVDVEEEKRLFYVGMTRAKFHLILTHAKKRMLFGHMKATKRSRFVGQIEAELLAVQRDGYEKKKPLPDNQMDLF